MTKLPQYSQLIATPDCLPAFERGVVPADFEDSNGHMNTAHYLIKASWAVHHALLTWGIPADWVDQGHATFNVEHHLRYLHEVYIGADISVRVRAVGRSHRAIHVVAYLLDETTQRLAYTMEAVLVHVDLGTRRSSVWPPGVAGDLDVVITKQATLAWQPEVRLNLR